MRTKPPTRLEILRRTRGITLQQLADDLCYSTSWLSWIERNCQNTDRVSRPLQKALAAYFGLSFEELIERVKAETVITTQM